ncbi:MAG TPA: HD domain-containing phosphohydrolase [Pirellulales bacterium]|jgi:putative two-component system response regulator
MQILVVDDNPIAIELERSTLARAGYSVLTALDGRQALEILEHSDCKMVITDWQMPGLTGPELCRAIRGACSATYIYIIMLTVRDEPGDTIEGMLAGADDFIGKPFRPSELIARVRAGERLLSLETRDLLIFTLAKLAESRDTDTGAHLERVRTYSRILAEQLSELPKYRDRVNAEFVRLIFLTSPLHDIGKVAVPDNVLLKPGPLTQDEFELMKRHTTHGAETLDAALNEFPSACYLRMAREIAATHHEWYDGSGYPLGLKGDEIPLCGRIVALADVYDALTCRRVYKAAYSHENARAIILQSRGTHFDPDVVDAFLANERRFMTLREELADPLAAQSELSLA